MESSGGQMKGVFLIKIFIPVIFALFFLNPPFAGAVETLALKPLLEEAKANNLELRAFTEKLKATEARAKVEGALDDPTLKVELEDLQRERPLRISPRDAMLTRYTISQMFPFPGKLSLKEKIALKEAAAAREELRSKELEILTLVKESYFDYAFLGESIRITEEIKELLSSMSKTVEVKFSTGQVSQQDVIKLQFEVASLTNDMITLHARKDIARERLKSLLNRARDAKMEEPPPLPKDRIEFATDELINAAVEKNPDIKMLASEAEATELNVSLAKKNYYPDFMVGVAPIQRDGRFENFDLMFQVNIPLWRGKYNSQVADASYGAQFLKEKLASEKNLKSLEVREAALMVTAQEKMLVLYETGLLPQIELSFESALKNYQSGKIDFLMLLDTGRDLKKTKIEYLMTVLEYRKMAAQLEKTAGKDF